jgi:hypothetical protein
MAISNRIITACLVAAAIVASPPLDAAWVADGIAICTVNGTEDTPTIVSDGAANAIVVWRDGRTVVNTDIYAQGVSAGGAVLWPANGNPACTANNSQSLPLIVPDGSGGGLVAWQDFRSNNVTDIYAQRINSSGYVLWPANGIPVCTGQTSVTLARVIEDGSGGAIIVWTDRRNATTDVFAQRIDSGGTVQWTANGVTVCAASGNQTAPAAATDGAGGAIVAWQDNRGGTNDIYAQRIDSGGVARWTADGVVICNAALAQIAAQIAPDGSGGAIISWTDHRNTVDDDIYAQRVDASGAVQWPANGVGIAAYVTGKQSDSRIVEAPSGSAIIAWLDLRNGSTADVYAQKVDAGGTAQWTANGVAVTTAANGQTAMQLVPDGSGGAVAAWQDERSASGAWDIYAQKILAGGTMAWTANGVAVCTATANQTAPALAPDGVGGAVIAWTDMRGGNADIYVQRVDAAGHTVVATTLQSWAAVARGTLVEIEWTLAAADEDVSFSVLRADERDGSFEGISEGAVARDGLSFSFADETCLPGETYRYRVDLLEGGARRVLFETGPVAVPSAPAALSQNHPNPFNPSTTIRYYVRERCRVTLEVYDASGALVRRLAEGPADPGPHEASWDGRDERGTQAGSGVYLCRLRAGKETLSRKMILIR